MFIRYVYNCLSDMYIFYLKKCTCVLENAFIDCLFVLGKSDSSDSIWSQNNVLNGFSSHYELG